MRADLFGVQQGEVTRAARAAFKGKLIGNRGTLPRTRPGLVSAGTLAGVAFGHPYVNNPDLVARVRTGGAFVAPATHTFYTNDTRGYPDYPTLAG